MRASAQKSGGSTHPIYGTKLGANYNPVKYVVGSINQIAGAFKFMSGLVLLSGSARTAPVLGVSVPSGLAGGYNLYSGIGGLRRGSLQIFESKNDRTGPQFKNLLGLLPSGQMYDDIAEPGAIEYWRGMARDLTETPLDTLKQGFKDFWVLE
mgnify:CR=1 FL=1